MKKNILVLLICIICTLHTYGININLSNFSSIDISYNFNTMDNGIISSGTSISYFVDSSPIWGAFNNGCDLEFLYVGEFSSGYPSFASSLNSICNTFPGPYTVMWIVSPSGDIFISIY